MKANKLEPWVRKILATEDEEISCSECFHLLSELVDAEVLGRPAPQKAGELKQHLNQCQVCREEYEILRELAQMDVDRKDPLPGK